MDHADTAYRRSVACDTGIVWTVRTAAALTALTWAALAVTSTGPYLTTALAATGLIAAGALVVVAPLATFSARALRLTRTA